MLNLIKKLYDIRDSVTPNNEWYVNELRSHLKGNLVTVYINKVYFSFRWFSHRNFKVLWTVTLSMLDLEQSMLSALVDYFLINM